MTLPFITDHPQWTHRLAVVLRFVDHFSGALVRTPLGVWTELPAPPPPPPPPAPPSRWLRAPVVGPLPPLLPPDPPGSRTWRARRIASDATYRFLLTNADIPVGTFTVHVDEPFGRYVSLEPILVALPRPRTPPPPPARRSDFMMDVPLWPTVRTPVAPGETVATGRITRVVGPDRVPVPGYRVRLFALPGPPAAAPYARSDDNGDFTFRFPGLRRSTGPPVVTTVVHGIEVRDAADVVVPPTPTSVPLPLGRVTVVEITVP